MSYGKNDAHLQRIGGYGASTSQQMGNAMRRQRGPQKGSPSWANNFQPREGIADTIRLIPGEFQNERVDETSGQIFMETTPWFEATEHYHGTLKKSIICSAGVFRMDQKKRKPCRGCDISHEDYQERRRIESEKGVKVQNPNRVSMSSKYVFLVLDMAWFFKGYQLDEHNRVKVNPNTNQPYQDWLKYDSENHNAYLFAGNTAQQQGKQLEMRQGMVRSWPLGFTQFGALNGYADVVQKHCRSCGNQNCINIVGWSCPTCNAPTIETSLPPDEVRKLVSKPLRCRHCQNTAYPKATHSCMYCPNPAPASLYDVDMQVQIVKDGRGNKTLIFPWVSGPRPIDPAYAKALEKKPDIEKKFAPTPYEEQVAKFGPAPGAHQVPAPHGQPQYGQQPPQAFGAYPTAGYGAPPAQPGWGAQPAQPQVDYGWAGYGTDEDKIPF